MRSVGSGARPGYVVAALYAIVEEQLIEVEGHLRWASWLEEDDRVDVVVARRPVGIEPEVEHRRPAQGVGVVVGGKGLGGPRDLVARRRQRPVGTRVGLAGVRL